MIQVVSLSINNTNMTLFVETCVSLVFYIFGWNPNMFPFILWNFWLSNSSFECFFFFFFVHLLCRMFIIIYDWNIVGIIKCHYSRIKLWDFFFKLKLKTCINSKWSDFVFLQNFISKIFFIWDFIKFKNLKYNIMVLEFATLQNYRETKFKT
jgi:hypothetical protein